MVIGTGAATKTWHLPRELLVNTSAFFAAALSAPFLEAISRKITFPEDGPDGFALFVQWLYVGEICSTLCEVQKQSSEDEKLAIVRVILQACSLGDKLDCPIFLDLAMLELIKHHKTEFIRVEVILFIYEHFGLGSKLRRFAIDQFRWDLQNDCYEYGEHVASFVSAARLTFVSAARSTEDFGPDFLEATLEAGSESATYPQGQREQYMEVLTVTEEE